MKTSSSRFSHRIRQRYANAGQIQGGMVTDADLVEAGQLHQARDEEQSRALVRSGTPADGGIVDQAGPALREGTVFAQGKQGQLVASEKLTADPVDIFAKQADLPLGPSKLPNGEALIYADLWDRTIRAQQDSYLADAGLHGAETGFRTRTMVQLKALPDAVASAKEAQDLLDKGQWPFCATGNAVAKLTKKNVSQDSKTADPCADKITAEREVPNALWRVEAIAVKSDPASGAVKEVTLAWSLKNAAGLESVKTLADKTAREAFERDTAVYEFLSEPTECQIGAFPDGHEPERPVLSEQLHPAAQPGNGRNGGKPFDLVRRWDGAATFTPQGNAVSGKLGAGATDGVATITTGVARIDTDAFAVEIPLTGQTVLAGDYWLVELRRFAKGEELRLVDEGAAHGPRHHFCLLIQAKGGDPGPLSKSDLYRLDFPSLTGLVADRVAFARECDDLYGDAQTVQEALAKLCELDASHVDFTPPGDCDRFVGAGTVQEALERLCKIEDSLTLERYLRLTADWGVLCGIDVTLKLTGANGLKWSGGTMLDRKGRLIDVAAGSVNLLTLPEEQILGGKLSEISEKNYWVCFALAADSAEGPVKPYLCDPQLAFGPYDPTFEQAMEACQKQGKIDLGKITDQLKDNETAYLDDTLAVWNKRGVLTGSAQLDDAGGEVMKGITDKMLASYLDTFEGAEKDAESRELKRLFQEAEVKYDPNRNAGISENVTRMNLYATKIGILALSEKFWKDNRTCDCRHLVVPCAPDLGEPPYLVPLGGVRFDFEDGRNPSEIVFFDPFGLRKQAMTWRSYRYYSSNFTPTGPNSPGDNCWQRPETRKLPDIVVKPPVLRPVPIDPPWIIDPEPIGPVNPKWPPREPIYKPVEPIYTDPGFVDPVGPLIDDLKVEAAKDTLEGSGFKIAEVIDTGGEDALAKLKELGGNTDDVAKGKVPKPGDTVALITSGGNAIDYVLIKEGTTKQAFETTASLKDKLAEIGIEVPEAGAAATVKAQPAPVVEKPDFSDVRAELDEITKAKDQVTVELGELSKSREDLLKAIEETKAELVNIGDERDRAKTDMQEMLTELERAREEQANVRLDIRRELPLDAVLGGNDQAVKALREAGVVSMRDVESLSATRLTQILRRGDVTNVNGSALKTNVNSFIRR